MASSFHLFLCFLIASVLFSTGASEKPQSLIFPIKKDNATLQYSTSLAIGTPPNSWDGVIDLGGQLVWLDCDNFNTSTYRPISCASSKCKAAKGNGCMDCNAPRRPGCANNTCGVYPYNPFKNLLYAQELGEDVTNGGSNPRTSIVLGGHQLENNLLEFDLSSSMLGFSSSLLLRNITCSHSRIF